MVIRTLLSDDIVECFTVLFGLDLVYNYYEESMRIYFLKISWIFANEIVNELTLNCAEFCATKIKL